MGPVKQLINQIRVKYYKHIARTTLMEWYSLRPHYDCGHELLQVVSPRMRRVAQKHDYAMAQLQKYDPECPAHVRKLMP